MGSTVSNFVGGVGSALGFGGGSTSALNKAGMEVRPEALAAEREAIQRNRDIASGKAQTVSELQYQQNLADLARQQMAMAASQRGASNPALAFRGAQEMTQQAGAEAGGKEALMAAQERLAANQALMNAANAQRGTALEAGTAEMKARQSKRATGLDIVSQMGSMASKAALAGG